jgi:uncharacterized protein
VHVWALRLHVHISAATLLLVLFFSLTGVTLNHPDVAFGGRTVYAETTGAIPSGWVVEGRVDWLAVAEAVRAEHGVRGSVRSRYEDEYGGQLGFRGPGYAADVLVDIEFGTFQLTSETQGLVGVLNDLHRGRPGGEVWKWLVDASAIFLAVIAVTGLALLHFLRKMRTAALVTFVVGTALIAPFVWLAMQ